MEAGYKLKTVRSNNGTEYTSAQFRAFRCLLFEKNLPKTMWAKVVNIAVYIQNGLPTKALAHKTPFKAWFGFKPSLAQLKIFGSICYAYIPAMKREKLESKAEPGIMVAYSSVKKGYRILNPLTNKVSKKNEPETVLKDLVANQTELDQISSKIDIDDEPVRSTRPLAEICERAQVAIIEPGYFEEAEAQQGWKQAMAEEISMIEKNQTWVLVERLAKRKIIGVKWVYQAQHNRDESLNKLKVRLVVKGFS
ncbi:uncharacterized protein [Gossypium hirsutum]|uniref:Retroviral polymerase SH3-like domain-containing protein n=1 Tax=Gossypium hirsutum TaxID=3635 RepID=A0ABM3B041_GOSHI|nr:uncharacterized protein LOC121223299 [Gossypium hirsutum]